MNEILSDLRYLLSLKRSCSFGTGDYSTPIKVTRVFGTDLTNVTPKSVVIKPKDTGVVYGVCGINFHIYHYPSYTSGKESTMMTPNQQNITSSSKFEGPHHPMCKIEKAGYSNYIITEDFVKYKGNKEIISNRYKCVDEALKDSKCDPVLLLGIIIVCYYSLAERLKFYIERLRQGLEIDSGHLFRPKITMKNIYSLMKKLNNIDKNFHKCAFNFLWNTFPTTLAMEKIFEHISEYFENENPEFLDFIFEEYEASLESHNPDIPKPEVTIFEEPERIDKTARKLF
jgi:hypothetical protein